MEDPAANVVVAARVLYRFHDPRCTEQWNGYEIEFATAAGTGKRGIPVMVVNLPAGERKSRDAL